MLRIALDHGPRTQDGAFEVGPASHVPTWVPVAAVALLGNWGGTAALNPAGVKTPLRRQARDYPTAFVSLDTSPDGVLTPEDALTEVDRRHRRLRQIARRHAVTAMHHAVLLLPGRRPSTASYWPLTNRIKEPPPLRSRPSWARRE